MLHLEFETRTSHRPGRPEARHMRHDRGPTAVALARLSGEVQAFRCTHPEPASTHRHAAAALPSAGSSEFPMCVETDYIGSNADASPAHDRAALGPLSQIAEPE